jgi:hypothetical protein
MSPFSEHDSVPKCSARNLGGGSVTDRVGLANISPIIADAFSTIHLLCNAEGEKLYSRRACIYTATEASIA